MKPQIVVYDRVVRVVRFEEVLQRAGPLLRCCLDIVDFDGGEGDGWVGGGCGGEEGREFE